jgi:hypothetical protein
MAEFMQKVVDKLANKTELKACYFIAILFLATTDRFTDQTIPLISSATVRELVYLYPISNPEFQALVEAMLTMILISSHSSSPQNSVTVITPSPTVPFPPGLIASELLVPLSSMLGFMSPLPGDLTLSVNSRLESDFARMLIDFIAAAIPSISYLPALVKSGGFLPPSDPGESRIDFGKHRGANFRHVIKDKGFCDWCERVTDPSSTGFVDWVDFICKDRFYLVMGVRTIRADTELIRIGKESFTGNNISTWISNRGLVAWQTVRFFYGLYKRGFPASINLISYAVCCYWIFSSLDPELPTIPIEICTLQLPRPRAEIIKEVFYPLQKLGDIFPEQSGRIKLALLTARAKSFNYSVEEARAELRNLHSIVV